MSDSIQTRFSPHLIVAILGVLLLGLVIHNSNRREGAMESARNGAVPSAASGNSASDERNVTRISKNRYRVIKDALTWAQASQRCAELGGHLASITTKQENDVVASLLPSSGPQASFFWIGLTDREREGHWKWSTGESWKYSNWNDTEPGNYGDQEDYAAIASSPVTREHGHWNDFDGPNQVHDVVRGFVCELPCDMNVATLIPPGAAVFGAHRYEFFREKVSWFWALQRCEEMGGHLVTITSREENDFVSSLLPRERDFDTYSWIGITDETKEGTWKWITSESPLYQNWRSGEPNNAGSNEDYAAITASHNKGFHGAWIDVEGPHRIHDILVGFLCEWEEESAHGRRTIESTSQARMREPQSDDLFRGHRYALFTEAVTWFQAKSRCEAIGGHLVAIETREELEFLTNKIIISGSRETAYWVGLTDTTKEGEWRWINGLNLGFDAWLHGEPNDFKGGEDYAAILSSPEKAKHGRMNDFEGPLLVHEMVVGFICEWEK